jgi:hypothetical protein
MAMQTDHFDSDEKKTLLARVLCPTSYGKSIYVHVPAIGKDRRTDGGAKDMGSGSVEFEGDIHDYECDDHVYLTFEPKNYGDGHKLTHVEPATFTDPLGADEPKFPSTDIPKTCPSCGREAAAVVKTEYDSMTGGKVADTADACSVGADNRGAWFEFSGEMTFIHGP